MKLDDPIDNLTEATMSDITTPRYGFAPTAAFATTRAGAERRALETAAAAALDGARSHSFGHMLRRFATRLGALLS
jgi:hypothetical protein